MDLIKEQSKFRFELHKNSAPFELKTFYFASRFDSVFPAETGYSPI